MLKKVEFCLYKKIRLKIIYINSLQNLVVLKKHFKYQKIFKN